MITYASTEAHHSFKLNFVAKIGRKSWNRLTLIHLLQSYNSRETWHSLLY